MASRASTPRSRSRSSTGSSGSSDTAMLDAPPQTPSRPVRLRHPSTSAPSTTSQPTSFDPSFSLLLSLPRELRERIYIFALTSSPPFSCPRPRESQPDKHKHNVSVNLLRANKQVYEEGESILYTANKFLFSHPSDCNIFRVVASPAAHNITCVYFRIREKDLRLWTSYMGSKTTERSLKFDLPKLKNLWIFMRYGSLNLNLGMNHAAMMAHGMQGGALAGLPPAVVVQVQAVQNALGQQIAALNQQNKRPESADDGQNDMVPPPPPPAPVPFTQFQAGALFPAPPPPPPPAPLHNHPHHPAPVVYGTNPNTNNHFLRFEREMGIESLCLALQETRHKDTDVKIVCTMRVPKREVERLTRMWPEDMERSGSCEARTRFRRVGPGGVECCLEVSGYDMPGESRARGAGGE